MTAQTEKCADWLFRAHAQRRPFQKLPPDIHPQNVKDAYSAQQAFHAIHLGPDGRGPIGGRKIALASKVQQQLCNIDHPIAGGIFAREIQETPFQAQAAHYHGLGIEYEIAIKLAVDVEPGSSWNSDAVAEQIASVHPALEMIIDRGADYQNIDVHTMIADNAWCAGIVLGPPVDTSLHGSVDSLDCTLKWNNEAPQSASSAASSPLDTLTWVLNLVADIGDRIPAGQPIITGSVLKTRYPVPGDQLAFSIADQSVVEMSVV